MRNRAGRRDFCRLWSRPAKSCQIPGGFRAGRPKAARILTGFSPAGSISRRPARFLTGFSPAGSISHRPLAGRLDFSPASRRPARFLTGFSPAGSISRRRKCLKGDKRLKPPLGIFWRASISAGQLFGRPACQENFPVRRGRPGKMKNIFWGVPKKWKKGNAFFRKRGFHFLGPPEKGIFLFFCGARKKGGPLFQKGSIFGGARRRPGRGGQNGGGQENPPGKIKFAEWEAGPRRAQIGRREDPGPFLKKCQTFSQPARHSNSRG